MKNKICIIGLGYVGFPLFLELKKKKFQVIGYDNNEKKIKKFKKNFSSPKKIIFTSSKSDIKNSNVYVICVPTPLNDSLEPDTSFIDSAVSTIISVIKNGDLIIFESTCYPGCTKEMVVDRIEREKKLKFKKNFFVSYSPERIDPANKKFKIKDIPKIIGSECKKSLKLTDDIYKKIFKKTYILHKFEEAELAKLIENVFRQVNIGLINEMAMMCEKLQINIWNSIKASSTKPFGFMPFFPGPGTGGHCIPLDPTYLSWKAKSKNFFSKYIDLANEINQKMPNYVVQRVEKFLSNQSVNIDNCKLLVIGLSYKKDVSDYRESSALKVFKELYLKGTKVEFHDEHVKNIKFEIKNKFINFSSVELSEKNIALYDAVIVLTDHSYVNWKKISKHAKSIFDTRAVCKNNFQNIEYL